MIVNIIGPKHGKVLDPACGSGAMFVQRVHFYQNPQEQATFYGQEKTPDHSACEDKPSGAYKILFGVLLLLPPASLQKPFRESIEPVFDQRELPQTQSHP